MSSSSFSILSEPTALELSFGLLASSALPRGHLKGRASWRMALGKHRARNFRAAKFDRPAMNTSSFSKDSVLRAQLTARKRASHCGNREEATSRRLRRLHRLKTWTCTNCGLLARLLSLNLWNLRIVLQVCGDRRRESSRRIARWFRRSDSWTCECPSILFSVTQSGEPAGSSSSRSSSLARFIPRC